MDNNFNDKLIHKYIDKYPWLVYYQNKFYCSVCLEYSFDDSKFTYGCKISRKQEFDKHAGTEMNTKENLQKNRGK